MFFPVRLDSHPDTNMSLLTFFCKNGKSILTRPFRDTLFPPDFSLRFSECFQSKHFDSSNVRAATEALHITKQHVALMCLGYRPNGRPDAG